MRLIDADALSDEVDKSKRNNPHPQGIVRINHTNEHSHFWKMVYDAPTIDAVEVVRCKDCLYYRCDEGCPLHESGYFKNGKMLPLENDFCSYGERRGKC